jgi:hypothetical protein
MIFKTPYSVPISLIDTALKNIPSDQYKFTLNKPTGSFFYDPWIIKEDLKNTVWEEIYKTLPESLGEARLICLEGGKQYQSHADIDDRYHLNLSGDSCFLVDLRSLEMHATTKDGVWYEMNAGVKHSAINFGNKYRYQIVVRKLLIAGNIKNKRRVVIRNSQVDPDDARYYFDDVISPWLNDANKRMVLANFSFNENTVSFDIEDKELPDLSSLFNDFFQVEIK